MQAFTVCREEFRMGQRVVVRERSDCGTACGTTTAGEQCGTITGIRDDGCYDVDWDDGEEYGHAHASMLQIEEPVCVSNVAFV